MAWLLSSEKIDPVRRIEHGRPAHQRGERLQYHTKEQPGKPGDVPASGQGPKEISQRSGQNHFRPADPAHVYHRKTPEQVPVPKNREPREGVGPFTNLLHEGCFGMDKGLWL